MVASPRQRKSDYSILTTLGELIGEQTTDGVWVDRVLGGKLDISGRTSTFGVDLAIWQGGATAYGSFTKPLSSPMLGFRFDATNATFSTVVWPQSSYVHQDRTLSSELLVQQHVRDAGDGVVEITHVWTNYGTETFDTLYAPWAGLTKTLLANYAQSEPSGSYKWVTPVVSSSNVVPLKETNGWVGFCSTIGSNSPGLGVVFGKSASKTPAGVVQFGTVNNNDLTTLKALPTVTLGPGQTFFSRFYLVIGLLPQIQAHGNQLAAGHVDWGTLSFAPAETESVDPCTDSEPQGFAQCGFYSLARPVPGAWPILLMRNLQTGKAFVSTTPYALSQTPDDGTTTRYLAFLGWGIRAVGDAPPASGYMKLGSYLTAPDLYPDPAKGRDVWVRTR